MADSPELSREIKSLAVEPQRLLLEAAQHNQVLGVGECHVGEPNVRPLITELMPQLKAAGITDLFIEVSPNSQPALDELNRTGKITDRSSLRWLTRHDSFVSMLEAANREGIRIHPADTDGEANQRDRTMSNAIEETLRQNPGSKGMFFVGFSHLKRGDYSYPAGTFSAAANQLRADGISLYSIAEDRQLCEQSYGDPPPISQPTGFRTNSSESMASARFGGARAGDWDAIIAFPAQKENRVDMAHTESSDADLQLLFHNYLTDHSRPLITQFDLRDNAIGDASLDLLTQLPNLKEVDLRQTRVTADGIKRLQAKMPSLTVHWDQPPTP